MKTGSKRDSLQNLQIRMQIVLHLRFVMTLKQARMKARSSAYLYQHWNEIFKGCHQPSLEDFLTQLIYETAQAEQEVCEVRGEELKMEDNFNCHMIEIDYCIVDFYKLDKRDIQLRKDIHPHLIVVVDRKKRVVKKAIFTYKLPGKVDFETISDALKELLEEENEEQEEEEEG